MLPDLLQISRLRPVPLYALAHVPDTYDATQNYIISAVEDGS